MPETEIELEDYLKSIKPKEDIPFGVVVKVICGKNVFPMTDSPEDKQLLKDIKTAVKNAGQKANQKGIFTSRPNEAGNEMEPFLKEELNLIGLFADIPKNSLGKKQSTGYPDIYVKDRFGRHSYIEVKTHNHEVDVTKGGLRAFYMSPPKANKSKIIYDARHLIVGFGLERTLRQGKTCFVPKNYHIVSIHNMKVNLKYEFNTDSAGMYKQDAVLDQGTI